MGRQGRSGEPCLPEFFPASLAAGLACPNDFPGSLMGFPLGPALEVLGGEARRRGPVPGPVWSTVWQAGPGIRLSGNAVFPSGPVAAARGGCLGSRGKPLRSRGKSLERLAERCRIDPARGAARLRSHPGPPSSPDLGHASVGKRGRAAGSPCPLRVRSL